MQSGMYSALFGALSSEFRLNSIANDLANVNTTGYKSDALAFENTLQLYAHDQMYEPITTLDAPKLFPEPVLLSKTRLALSQTVFAQGALKTTGNPLDLAISGDGFFKVQTPEGEFYTRNGNFLVTAEGTLVTTQGFPVVGEGGEVTIPLGSGQIVIAEDGRIFADNELVGQVGLFSVDNLNGLEKQGQNMYKVREGDQVAEEPFTGRVVQGFLESSNVDPVYAMVNMIEAQRYFEAMTKVMQTNDALDKEAITKVSRGRA